MTPEGILNALAVEYVTLRENTLEILDVFYDLDSLAENLSVTRKVVSNLVRSEHPYNIIRRTIAIKKEALVDYFNPIEKR